MDENKKEDIKEEMADQTEETVDTQDEVMDAEFEQVPEDNDPQNASDAQEAVESGEEAEDSKKKSFFGKKKKDKKDQQIEELTDRVQRQMAEFDNFRKRSEKEKAAMYEIGAKSVVEKILPTIDNFERGFAALTQEQKAEPFADGMDKVYRQMMTTLEEIGVKPIEAVGKEFDQNFHSMVKVAN